MTMTNIKVRYIIQMNKKEPGGKWFEVDEMDGLEYAKERYNKLILNPENRSYKLRLIKRTTVITNGVIFSE